MTLLPGSQIVGLLQFLLFTNLLYFSLWSGSDKFFFFLNSMVNLVLVISSGLSRFRVTFCLKSKQAWLRVLRNLPVSVGFLPGAARGLSLLPGE